MVLSGLTQSMDATSPPCGGVTVYTVAYTALRESDPCAEVAVIGSLKGLSSNNSSGTYPVIVPSENVTITPSLPSHSTVSIFMSLSMNEMYSFAILKDVIWLTLLRWH